jgi:hypothetical protein
MMELRVEPPLSCSLPSHLVLLADSRASLRFEYPNTETYHVSKGHYFIIINTVTELNNSVP